MDYGGGDHLTEDRGGVWLVGRRSVCGRRLSLQVLAYMPMPMPVVIVPYPTNSAVWQLQP